MENKQKTKREIIPNVNLPIEQAVITGVLSSLDAIFNVGERLRAQMFSHSGIRFVYEAILALGNVTRKIRLIALEIQIPVVVLAQMNSHSNHRQTPHFLVLSDLLNSGAIEQIADVVIFV